MRKISFWRYSAVNRQTLFCALACALLVFSMGCGSTNNLQSITLCASFVTRTRNTGRWVRHLNTWVAGTNVYVGAPTAAGRQKLLDGSNLAYQIATTPYGRCSEAARSATSERHPAARPSSGARNDATAYAQLTPPRALFLCGCRRTPANHSGLSNDRLVYCYGYLLGTLSRPALSIWLLRVAPLLPLNPTGECGASRTS